MVFHSFVEKKNEAAAAAATEQIENMASSTAAKSQPLHNFSLPDLKWAMNQTNTNRFRKLSDSSHKSPPPSQNEAADSDSDKCQRQSQNQNQSQSQSQNPVVLVEAVKTEESVAKKKHVTADDVADNSEKKPAASSDGSRSKKIFIRIRTNKNNKVTDEVADIGDHNSVVAEDAEESVMKTWNLRPRKLVTKANHNNNNNNNNVNGGALKIGGAAAQDIKAQTKVADKKEKEKQKKRKFSISISKQEIEDDFFIMTGTKPSRRPKKRARNVQRQLDYVFPGLWLASITPESYRVNDGSTKG